MNVNTDDNVLEKDSCSLKILCLIPARSGSKSLPDKNIRNFRGKPLLAWSIDQATKCRFNKNMRIIVSTDSSKYMNIAKEYGAEVPFLRPGALSQDDSTDYEFVNHAVKWLEENDNYIPDIVLQLRPTQPLRKIQDIDNCIDLFIKNIDKYDSLRTVIELDKSPFKTYTIDNKKNLLVPLFLKINDINEPFNQCRQFLPKSYLHNGYIDLFKTSILKNKTISGTNIYPYVMNKEDCIDIDTLEDWNLALTK
jgi:N-acylneuraminate cytidylyltransferase